MYTSTITSKGQTTIPVDIRKALNLSVGDTIGYCLNNDGTLTIVPETSDVSELVRIMPKPKKKVSIEEMRLAIINSVIKKRKNYIKKANRIIEELDDGLPDEKNEWWKRKQF